MTLRLSEEQTGALRRRAEPEGRSMHQVAVAALNDNLLRTEDNELTERLAEQGAQRFAELLRRLGERRAANRAARGRRARLKCGSRPARCRVNRPRARVLGQVAYVDVFTKAAALRRWAD